MKKLFSLFALLALLLPMAVADEGTCIPMLLGSNEDAMQKEGMSSTAREINDITND